MAITNSLTAAAATRTAPDLNQSITLLGIYTSDDEVRALIRKGSDAPVMLPKGVPQDGLTLLETGDGWAMVQGDRHIHRLVIA